MFKLFLAPNSYLPLLKSRFGRLDILGAEVLNQFFRLIRSPRVFRLTTVGIETNNTCNLHCSHCPTNTSMRRSKGIMSWELYRQIIDLNPGLKRVYLTNWGEPLLHPQIIDMINYAHQKRKLIAITTNATLLDENTSQRLIQAGLDIIKISIDGGPKIFEKIRGFSYQRVEKNIINFLRIRDSLGAKTWIEVSMLVYKETIPQIEPFFNLWKKRVDYLHLQPKFFTFRRKKLSPCRDLWRYLVVLWDGRVVPCCADSEGELLLGRADQDCLQDIFAGEAMQSLRQAHLRGQAGSLCQDCLPYFTDYHISLKQLKKLSIVES